MTIYNIYIFNKNGVLLYYQEWTRLKHSGMTKEEEAKLMYGLIFSLKSFVSKISPIDPKSGLQYLKTSKYNLHLLQTASGLKFILNTDNYSTGVKEILQYIYSQIYVEHIVKNPIHDLQLPIDSELFKSKIDSYIKQHPVYLSKSS